MSNPAFKFDHVHIISDDPHASADWYVRMFGAAIRADTVARGAPQIFVDLGGMTILIRGKRREKPRLPRGPFGNTRTFPAMTRGGPTILAFCTGVISKHSATSCEQKAPPCPSS
jgi:catechol 2,3-dioxygenase-like lactoylglutathione lyase family enzyme